MTVHVPSQWPAKLPAKIAFIGEAPSDEEITAMKPLVGPAGAVFNQALRAANLDRKEYFIGNLFDEQAEDNDVGPWLADAGRLAEARQRLSEELAKARPNVIVPLGGNALFAFTGFGKITGFRGAVTPATYVLPGAKLLPTFHPAAVLRQWKLLSLVVGDFVKAAREAQRGPKILYPKRQLLIEPTLDDVERFSEECLASDLLSMDIETGWGQITCIGFAPTAERAMCIPFVDKRKPNRNYWATAEEEFQVWKHVRRVCESPVPKLGQNFIYDFIWIYEEAGIEVRNYHDDTRLLSHALYPELPKDLATMAGSYTDVGAWKHYGGRYHAAKRDS